MKVLACDKVDAGAIQRIRAAGHEVTEGNALKGAELVAALAGVQDCDHDRQRGFTVTDSGITVVGKGQQVRP